MGIKENIVMNSKFAENSSFLPQNTNEFDFRAHLTFLPLPSQAKNSGYGSDTIQH